MNATNVFLDILKSAITQTECDNLDGLDTDVWIRVYDISQKQQLSPLIYQQIFSNPSFWKVIRNFRISGRWIRSIRQVIRFERVFYF